MFDFWSEFHVSKVDGSNHSAHLKLGHLIHRVVSANEQIPFVGVLGKQYLIAARIKHLNLLYIVYPLKFSYFFAL